MSQQTKQNEAARHIRGLLSQRGIDIPSFRLLLPDNQQWVIFEYKDKQLGIDSASGVWVRGSERESWRCVCMPCTVSGAVQAIEFLTTE